MFLFLVLFPSVVVILLGVSVGVEGILGTKKEVAQSQRRDFTTERALAVLSE